MEAKEGQEEEEKEELRHRCHSLSSLPAGKQSRRSEKRSVLPGRERDRVQSPSSSTGGAATVTALTGLPVVRDGESLVVHGAPEAPVHMEVDPAAGI